MYMTTIKQYLEDKEKISDIEYKNKSGHQLALIIAGYATFMCLGLFPSSWKFEIIYLLLIVNFFIIFELVRSIVDKLSNSAEEKVKFDSRIIYKECDLYIYEDCAYVEYYSMYKNYINTNSCDEIETVTDSTYILEIPGVGEFYIKKEIYGTLISDKTVLKITGELYDRVLSLVNAQE